MTTYYYYQGGFEFTFDVREAAHKAYATATFPTALPGLGKSIKATFGLNAGQEITSLRMFTAKGAPIATYSDFAIPKGMVDFIQNIQVGDADDAYYSWNYLLLGSFKVVLHRPGVTDVGTDGTATVIGSKGNDRVVIPYDKTVVFKAGKGVDTVTFVPQQDDEGPTSGADVALTRTFNQNPYGTGTLKLVGVENLIGTLGDDHFHGNSAANRLDGGAGGVDHLLGEDGNDTLVFRGQIGTADGGSGRDTLYAAADSGPTQILDLGTPGNNAGIFADATVTGIEVFHFDGFGPTVQFYGTGGGQTVYAGDGDDILKGYGGGDVLVGGRGSDDLEGGAGADRFVYRYVSDSVVGVADTIRDLFPEDRIDLRAIDADQTPGAKGNQAFTWIGSKGFHGKAGELRVLNDDAPGVRLQGDVDGDGIADFVLDVDNWLTGIPRDLILL